MSVRNLRQIHRTGQARAATRLVQNGHTDSKQQGSENASLHQNKEEELPVPMTADVGVICCTTARPGICLNIALRMSAKVLQTRNTEFCTRRKTERKIWVYTCNLSTIQREGERRKKGVREEGREKSRGECPGRLL